MIVGWVVDSGHNLRYAISGVRSRDPWDLRLVGVVARWDPVRGCHGILLLCWIYHSSAWYCRVDA